MAGQLTHLCLVDSVSTPEALDQIPTLIPSVRAALDNYHPFCRLGAVSPDCPAFVGSTDAMGWSGIMHYLRPADFVRYAIPQLLTMSFNTADTRACIAWLFGYASHLVADLTVHPIVAELVGPYSIKKNRKPHRNCELNQDVYIFHKLTGREVLDYDFLEFSGLDECATSGSLQKLNRAANGLWEYALCQYPRDDTKAYVRLPATTLDPDNWFASYVNLMENFATKGTGIGHFFGLSYPRLADLDCRFIENLKTPNSSGTIHFDELFELTRQNIIKSWTDLARSLAEDDAKLFTLANADLDTGMNPDGHSVYWS